VYMDALEVEIHMVRQEGFRRWEHGGEVKLSVQDSGDVLWSDQQGVGGQSIERSEPVCTREWRCVMVGVGKCRMLETSGEMHMDALDSGDVVWSDQEGLGDRTTMGKGTWMH
jgi:hypothetical protein